MISSNNKLSKEPVVVLGADQPLYRGGDGIVANVLIDAQTCETTRLALGNIWFGAGRDVPAHTRPCDEFIYVVEGSTTIKSYGKDFVLSSGDAIFIPAGTEHQHTNPNDTTLRQVYIFTPAGPEEAVRAWPIAEDDEAL